MRKHIRAVAIIIKDSQVLLMKRNRFGEKYNVFPGGGVENNETVEEAVLREVMEETTLEVKIDKLLYHHHYPEDSDQYFYLCSHISGTPQLGDGNEKESMDKKTGDYYEPMWVEVDALKDMLVYPLEIRDWLLKDIKDNFKNTPRKAIIDIKDLRRTL
ncbi:MAG: NUDIX domain-containing protein [Patescibacteria group bacterium]|jgi:mutator protein MutT